MKKKLLNFLKKSLKKLAHATIWRYKPLVIAITGSVGKTSAKEATYAILKDHYKVRKASGNFNNEIGVPLTILGEWEEIKGPLFWLKVVFVSLFHLLIKTSYPEILILEYAADKPNDIKYLLEIARPKIGIVTAIGEIPSHIEFYADRDALVREKTRLVEQLPVSGYAILNCDDPLVKRMEVKTRGKVMTFGFSFGANFRITNLENFFEDDKLAGITFKVNYQGNVTPFKIKGVLGRSHAYAAAAASCVGLILELNLVQISESLFKNYKPASHRMNLVKGIKDTLIIDDSYNASPLSMREAIVSLGEIKNHRRIAVLGDMLELGRFAPESHEMIGALAKPNIDFLITIGPRARFIIEGALSKGFDKNKIFGFSTVSEAQKFLQSTIRKGDIILIKASRAMGLDKIVDNLKAV
jgi:UDP-N-acetylmuramoyl-tripeptide--D-alanyl-D-alanine ligase